MAGNLSQNTRIRRAIAAIGAGLGVIGLLIIWGARLTLHRPAYVSELGADGEPTARWFEFALLLVVASAAMIAWTARGIVSTAWLIGRWAPSVSLAATAALFFVASQVSCTAGCPLPVGESFTVQDFVHTLAAVLAFAAASVAMLQAAFAQGRPMVRRLSLVAAISVAVIASAGGILSLLRFGTDVGSVFELIATTIGIGWAVAFGAVIASDTPAVTFTSAAPVTSTGAAAVTSIVTATPTSPVASNTSPVTSNTSPVTSHTPTAHTAAPRQRLSRVARPVGAAVAEHGA